MYRGWMTLGGIELANAHRTMQYMDNGVAPLTTTVTFDDTWPHTARWLGHQPYRLPQLDTAPWYDPNEPDSKEFAGMWPLSIEGGDLAGMDREIIEGIGHGGGFGIPRLRTRSLKISALVIGSSAAGVDFGLQWLTSVLRGDRCAGDFAGQTLSYLSSTPKWIDPEIATSTLRDCVAPYRRDLYEVVCTALPEIVERFGVDRCANTKVASAYRVEFEITAGTPWAWAPTEVLLDDLVFDTAREPESLYFMKAVDGVCQQTTCPDTSTLYDPQRPPLTTVVRPVPPSENAPCLPLEYRRTSAVLSKRLLTRHQDTVATVTITAGGRDERGILLRWIKCWNDEGDFEEQAACNTVSEAAVQYLPSLSTLYLHGPTERPYVLMRNGDRIDAAPVVVGIDGGPWQPPVFNCDCDYLLVLDAPIQVSPQLHISVTGTVRTP